MDLSRHAGLGVRLAMQSWAELRVDVIQDAASQLTGRPVGTPVRVEGGSNNRVYKVAAGGSEYALKLYWKNGAHKIDRLEAEFGALNFLRKNDVRCVPEAIACSRPHRLALYEWIEGEPVSEATESDLIQALDFIRTLHTLRNAEGAGKLPFAAETCMSARELVRQVESRFEKLERIGLSDERLNKLLHHRIKPVIKEIVQTTRNGYRSASIDFCADLEPEFWTLSPADFGFHNSRQFADGRLIFLDFEYFGWDDPVKLAMDFIIHPGMTLSEDRKSSFLKGVKEIFSGDPNFVTRTHLLSPLYTVRWCLIVLNEFLPERWAHRNSVWRDAERDYVLSLQFTKAERLLADAESRLRSYPFGS